MTEKWSQSVNFRVPRLRPAVPRRWSSISGSTDGEKTRDGRADRQSRTDGRTSSARAGERASGRGRRRDGAPDAAMEDESCEAASDGGDLVATADAVHDHRHHHLQHQIAGQLESHEEQQQQLQLHHDSEFEEEPVLGKIESPHNKPVLGREPATEWSETATSVLIAAFRYKQNKRQQ